MNLELPFYRELCTAVFAEIFEIGNQGQWNRSDVRPPIHRNPFTR